MKKSFRTIFLFLLCLAFIFTAGCSAENAENNTGVLEQKQEGYTFTPQEIQPIEENPSMLPMQIDSESGLHRLDVKRPIMDEIDHSDDVINAILGSADQVAILEKQDLLNSSHLETEDQLVNKTLSADGAYLEMSIQRIDNEQEDENQNNDQQVSGQLAVDGLTSYVFSTEEVKDSSNRAILFKYRYNTPVRGFNIGFFNGKASIQTSISNDNNLWIEANNDSMGYLIDNGSDYINSLKFIDNEWYFTLSAFDKNYGYRYITWQENNPSNHAFYACDLGAIFKPYHFEQERILGANLLFWTEIDEINVDIESLKVYEFERFNDVESVNPNDEPAIHTYADDQEKYDLAVQLFEAEDYFNAYTLFTELDGFDTSDYLAECERLLKTIEINNTRAAGRIRKALQEQGIPIYEVLYVYQAEKLESLDLSECLIEDLGFISNFSNLKELNLDKNAISDLTPLKELYSLERLALGKNHISDITPLSSLANLRVLDLNNNLLEDVSALNNLPSLIELNLATNNILSIDNLNNLINLESVNLSYNLISSVSAFEKSPLKDLNIMNTDINDLHAVANLPELESLKAGFRYNWKGNENYLLTRKYEIEDHFFMGLTGLEALAGHNNLKRLYLASLSDDGKTLEPLAGLTNLESLAFHRYSGESDPNVLGSLVNLKELALDSAGNGFYSTSFLANLTKLEKLYIGSFCYVDDISNISGLKNLKELRMYKYSEDLSFLTGLNNLRLLELIDWAIDDYSPLLTLDNLEYLTLQGMRVNDLSVIAQLENLKVLRLDSSQINNIKDIGQLENLEYFLMQNTTIIGDSGPELFDRSLFDGLDHLKYVYINIRGENDFGYGFGNPEFEEILEEPLDKGIEEPEYDYLLIDNPNSLNHLSEYTGHQNQIIDVSLSNIGESAKITIPKYVRNLYIFSYDDQPAKIELDCDDHKGLERLVVGYVDVSGTESEVFGQGDFIIENLDGLASCTNLKEVYINSTEINDISALESLDKLEVVELNEEDLSNLYK